MFANVQNGIDRKSGILKEVDQLVEQSDRSKDKRARALYQSWNEQVYSNIQKQIQDQLSALTTEEIEARLNRKYDAFLQASNQKAGVFMNGNQSSTAAGPATGGGLTGAGGTGGAGAGGGSLAHQAGASDKLATIKVSTAKLNDPLKRSLLKIKEEKSIITGLPSATSRRSSSGASAWTPGCGAKEAPHHPLWPHHQGVLRPEPGVQGAHEPIPVPQGQRGGL